MLESNLQNLITSDQRFITIAEDRLTPVLLPEQSSFPAATYQTISILPLYATDSRINLTRYRIQFDTWAKTYAEAKTVSHVIEAILDSYFGPFADGGYVDSIQIDSSGDLFEQSARLYRVTSDFIIQYSAPATDIQAQPGQTIHLEN